MATAKSKCFGDACRFKIAWIVFLKTHNQTMVSKMILQNLIQLFIIVEISFFVLKSLRRSSEDFKETSSEAEMKGLMDWHVK